MTTIRVIYEAEPDFPPTDQHPDAVRYQVGEYWVDAIGCEAGGAPAGEVDQVLEDLGRLLYQERREARERMAQQIIDKFL
jgi:hypothetical protein